MIDLHCHIVPGIDDGAQELDDAVAMASQAAADGIELVCATPHIRHDHDVRIEALRDHVAELNTALERARVSARVLAGGEVAETTAGGLSADELRRVSLGAGRRWILVEPAPGPLSDSLRQTVDDLAARGFRSVIAHPERHLTADLERRLAELIARGALVQATAAFMIEPETAAAMAELAMRGLIHVLGSDSHSAVHGRPVELSGGLAALSEIETTAPHIDWIARAAPSAIIAGRDVEPPYRPLA
ncbi:MAG TPA: CpsB/CapC family capsule biosynthesis tyrosine phosphatase [Solirubrobacterales bacterium]|nr:CpsB/CapC family capsule biosynthesis tyrosine phosphatase [Solirubrobacterales bacterium]